MCNMSKQAFCSSIDLMTLPMGCRLRFSVVILVLCSDGGFVD